MLTAVRRRRPLDQRNYRDRAGMRRYAVDKLLPIKGLGFQAVFVVSVNAEMLPHRLSYEDPDDALEVREARQRERQLLYVNVTRARELVHLSLP